MKRWMPKAYGRAGQILKRTSNIKLTLDERIEGKGRKTKEQMEKEKEDRLKSREKKSKDAIAEETAKDSKKNPKKNEKVVEKEAKTEDKAKKGGETKGLMTKIFRRKSM